MNRNGGMQPFELPVIFMQQSASPLPIKVGHGKRRSPLQKVRGQRTAVFYLNVFIFYSPQMVDKTK